MNLGLIIGGLVILLFFGNSQRSRYKKAIQREKAKKDALYARAREWKERGDGSVFKVKLLNPTTTPYGELKYFVDTIFCLDTLRQYIQLSKDMNAPIENIKLIQQRLNYLKSLYNN